MAYILGITGGMSSGKTTASKCLQGERTYVIDADELARPLHQPGCEVYNQIVEKFGKSVCNLDGSINNKRLARVAFATITRTKMLNEIFKEPLTNAIKLEIMQGRAQRASLIIIVAAILFEQEWDKLCHGVLNISAPESLRLERAMRRGMTERDAQRRMAAQLTEKDRMALAQWTVYTQPTKEELCKKINKLAEENKWL